MNSLKVLDCTLRDGGYCNQWSFGKENIVKIINGLVKANIDIVECGFLTNKITYDQNISKYNKVEQINGFIPSNKQGKVFVAMINYGEYNIEDLPDFNDGGIDGFRVAFHKKNRFEALELCKKIKAKGYKVFIQPMVSISYNDFEFIEMIEIVNGFEPYAFYIVDSFGMMKNKDLLRFFYMVENNLNDSIKIGFHSHNNLQLAYSNTLSLINVQTNRDLIVDSSVMGMGRGAGNLNTELFVEHLNENYGGNYVIRPLLKIVDEVLTIFYHKNYWGYSLPNYLSAKHNTHPNYAGFLTDKNTLTFENIDEIFEMMEDDKRVQFDKDYIENLYLQYMEKTTNQDVRNELLRNEISGKTIILIAPGKSSVDESYVVDSIEDSLKIAVNCDYHHANLDYLFVSNIKRFKSLSKEAKSKSIVTSNIPYDGVYFQTSYKQLLNNEEFVEDNAGLMAIRFLIDYGAKKIFLVGFDGYSHDTNDNYGDSRLQIVARNAVLDKMNEGMNKILKEYSKAIDIAFLTKERHLGFDK